MANNFFLLTIAIILTATGQVFTKLGANRLPHLPMNHLEIPLYLVKAVFTPFIFAGLSCVALASFAWIVALSKLKLSYAYPIMSFSYVLVMFLSAVFLKEHISNYQWIGVTFICIGIIFISRA